MTTIYSSDKVDINYDALAERAEIVTKGQGANPISFALIKNTEDSSCWDNFTTFILKHFTWTWIVVKDEQGNDTNQIANITSIAKHVGLTPKEIKKANKAGNLFLEIDRKLNCTLPDAVSLDQLMRTNTAMLRNKGYVVDDSSEAAFLQTIAASYQKDPALSITIGVFFASFAIKHFKYVDVAEDWMKTTFNDEGYVSVNKFQPADISCFKGSSESIRINMQIELNKLK